MHGKPHKPRRTQQRTHTQQHRVPLAHPHPTTTPSATRSLTCTQHQAPPSGSRMTMAPFLKATTVVPSCPVVALAAAFGSVVAAGHSRGFRVLEVCRRRHGEIDPSTRTPIFTFALVRIRLCRDCRPPGGRDGGCRLHRSGRPRKIDPARPLTALGRFGRCRRSSSPTWVLARCATRRGRRCANRLTLRHGRRRLSGGSFLLTPDYCLQWQVH